MRPVGSKFLRSASMWGNCAKDLGEVSQRIWRGSPNPNRFPRRSGCLVRVKLIGWWDELASLKTFQTSTSEWSFPKPCTTITNSFLAVIALQAFRHFTFSKHFVGALRRRTAGPEFDVRLVVRWLRLRCLRWLDALGASCRGWRVKLVGKVPTKSGRNSYNAALRRAEMEICTVPFSAPNAKSFVFTLLTASKKGYCQNSCTRLWHGWTETASCLEEQSMQYAILTPWAISISG